MEQAVARFVAQYHTLGVTGDPAYPKDVAALERHLGLPLPAAYRAYLLVAGNGPPPGMVGSDCTLRRVYTLREGAERLLSRGGSLLTLPTNAVVFWMHQGYQFAYFLAGSDGDPLVSYYHERRAGSVVEESRLSEWLAAAAVHG